MNIVMVQRMTAVLAVMILLCGVAFSQWDGTPYPPGTAELNIPIRTGDNAPSPNHRWLHFGLDPTATDSLDVHLGALDLPPMPPAGVFETRWDLTPFLPPGTWTIHSQADYRFGEFPFTGEYEKRLIWQLGENANAFIIDYFLPTGVEIQIIDELGGIVFDSGVVGGEGSFTIDVPLTSAKIYVFYDNATPPAPEAVILSQPEDGAVIEVEMGEQLTFVWHASQPNVTNYQLDIAIDPDFAEIVYSNDEITDTTLVLTVDDEDVDGEYYWRVRAGNEWGWSDFSDVWSFSLFVVGVGDINIPTAYRLEQNYPNPFNPATTIRYAVPERSSVKIEVYNAIGQHVATLVNTVLETGVYDVEWHSGGTASGVYYYRMEAVSLDNPSNRHVQMKSMVVLK